MRKLFLTAFLVLSCSVVSNASDSPCSTNDTYVYTTWCGKKVQTVPPSYFENDTEAQEHYNDLNEIYCGSREAPHAELQPTTPQPTVP